MVIRRKTPATTHSNQPKHHVTYQLATPKNSATAPPFESFKISKCLMILPKKQNFKKNKA